MYERLVAFTKEYKHTRVPRGYKPDPQLANWVKRQRETCQKKDRIDLLNDIGFEWRLREQNDWMEMYERLVAFKKKEKDTRVSFNFKADPKLSNWVRTQRSRCTRSDRIDLLNDIGFVWTSSTLTSC